MCPSAEYRGMQKLNIDQSVNPLEVKEEKQEGNQEANPIRRKGKHTVYKR